MKSKRFHEPRLGVVRGENLRLSGVALLELMRAALARGVAFRFCARGSSMDPFIRDGDVITISPLTDGHPRVGDVVAFTRPGAGDLVVHRMVARHGAAALIQGDGVPQCADGIIAPERLLGSVTRVERNGRDVWLGLGPERILIAWLSRVGLLTPVRGWLAPWFGPFTGR